MTELCNGCGTCLYGNTGFPPIARIYCAAPMRIFRECKNPSVAVWRYKQYMVGEIP